MAERNPPKTRALDFYKADKSETQRPCFVKKKGLIMNANGWHPGSILELSGAFWKTCTLHAAVKLDVFTLIDARRLGAAEVAAQAGTEDDATARLLDALTAMGLLIKEDGLYANTDAAAAYLSRSSDQYLGYMILHHHHLVDLWRNLDESVRTGRPVRGPHPGDDAEEEDEAEREAFLMGMYNNANLMAPEIVRQIDLKGRKRLLDMGGGPGTYAIWFCRQYKELAAVVFDLPTTRPFAEKVIEEAGMSGRIGFAAGSYLVEDLPGGFDVVWMSHILHGEGFDDCDGMVQRAWNALEPGGMIIIHEFIMNNERSGPAFPALFSLNMLVATDEGRAYTEKEISRMLEKSGFKDIRRLPWEGPTQSGLISAIK